MIYSNQRQFWRYQKKKIFFRLKNSVNSNIDVTNKKNPYKNLQKINFNKKHSFTIKKQFTLDWHIRPNKCVSNISKNKKLLKLASFYSQLTNNNFSKKFTYLMIFHLNIEMQELKKRKKNVNWFYTSNKNGINFFSNIEKLANFTEIELDKNKKIFTNLQYKNNIWFFTSCLPFSNRNFWWLLLPSQSILTHIHYKFFFQRITNFLENIKNITSTNQNKKLLKWNSTVLFDFFPEFLIEKPINWYWMLPFFGCIGLMNSKITFQNPYFFQNNYFTSNFENQLNLNKFSLFSQPKNEIEKEISYEIFKFFDYKKDLFDSSLKYINNLFLNRNNFVIKIKKTWFSKQKEHYICNYENFLIHRSLKKNVNNLTKLAIIYWWKQNWHEITHSQFILKDNSISSIDFNSSHFNSNSYLRNTLFFSKNTNSKVYCLDTLFYSKFYWYWHNLDTKNITNFLNDTKKAAKNHKIAQLSLAEKSNIDNIILKFHSLFSGVLSLFNPGLINESSRSVTTMNIKLIDCLSNNSFSSKQYPFKIQFPWMSFYFKNSNLKKIFNTKINSNSNSVKDILHSNFANIEIKKNYEKINNNKKTFFQTKKNNLIFKNILYSKIKKNENYKKREQLVSSFVLNNNVSQSSLLFCVSSKNQLNIKSNDFLKKDLKLTNKEYKFTDLLVKKKQKTLFNLNLYNSIGCEIFESDFNPIYKIKNNKNIYKNQIELNSKKNQSISSFHRASFLFENLLSTLFFQFGTTTKNSINLYSNNFNKIKKNPIIMSGFTKPEFNLSLKNKNRKERFLALGNHIPMNMNQQQAGFLKFFPNSFYNKNEFDDLIKQYTNKEDNYNTLFKGTGSIFSIIKKQRLSTLKKRSIDLKSKELEHFFVYNLLKNSEKALYKFLQLEKNRKKIEYNQIVFDKKNHSKYKIIKLHSLLNLQNRIRKVKENNFQLNVLNKKNNPNLLLLNYFDFIKKKEIDFKDNILFTQSKENVFSSFLFSTKPIDVLKIKKKKNFKAYNKNFIYVSNRSNYWNYINSNYSSRLLDAIQPFIFNTFDNFLQNVRINYKTNPNLKNSYFFSNFLLKKYQRKNPRWPGGSNPQGFFYKRINKLNLKSIQKKQIVQQVEKDDNKIIKILRAKTEKLKKISDLKPIGELLWEVRTKHKIPEVLLLQQTVFFQKKLVRKSTEENNKEYASDTNALSQKAQTFIRKMTHRRHFRKHLFLDQLFNWTRDAISLRKMLRKINFKNDWQLFLKFILKSKKVSDNSSDGIIRDYYSNWYKKNFYNDKQFFQKYRLFHNLNINIYFSRHFQKQLKVENIRPFLYKCSKTENNRKLLLSKNNRKLLLNDFYKNFLFDYIFVNKKKNKIFKPFNLKNNKLNFFNNYQNSLTDLKYFVNFQNPLLYPESTIFYYFSLPNIFIRKQYRSLININKSFNSSSFKFRMSSSLIAPKHPLIYLNRTNDPQLKNGNFFSDSSDEKISYYFINQQNLSKTGFELYNAKQESRVKQFNLINKSFYSTPLQDYLASPLQFSLNKSLGLNKKNNQQMHKQSQQTITSFLFNWSTFVNTLPSYQKFKAENLTKFFHINHNHNDRFVENLCEGKSLRQIPQNDLLNFYSNELSIRNHLFNKNLYFTNIFWDSNDVLLNSSSTIFNKNELIKNTPLQNWIFQIKPIHSQQNYEKEFHFNFHKVLATLSTWQFQFQIRRDLLLQVFYIYLDHIGAFLNYFINNLIFENMFNQIDNWIFLYESIFTIKNDEIKQNEFISNFKKELRIQPIWSLNLLNHIKLQYPNLYNKIKKNNQSNLENIQLTQHQILSNFLSKTPELDAKKNIIFSSNFKTQLVLIDSFKRNSGIKLAFLKNSNMFSSVYRNDIKFPFGHQSIIQKLSSETLINQNSTIFCEKWIQNRQLVNLYQIKFLKKQQKLRQVLNVFNQTQKNSKNILKNNNVVSILSLPFNFKRNYSLNKNITIMNFKRRPGFLFNRCLTTTNFNNFSSLSKISQTSISLYFSTNLETSLKNIIWLSQLVLLHVCLVFCLIFVYQSAFHFCLKNSVSIFVILIHYFLNIRYRLKRLMKYIYQNLAQPFIINITEYLRSSNSINNKLLLFLNNLVTTIFSTKFFIWGKINKSSIPYFINFVFKSPFNLKNNINIMPNSKQRLMLSTENHNKTFLPYLESLFYQVKQKDMEEKLTFKRNLSLDPNRLKKSKQKKSNNRLSLSRLQNSTQKNLNTLLFWNKQYANEDHLLQTLIPIAKKTRVKKSSTFQFNFKLVKWNLGLILLIGESEIFAELEPYREMHWYFLKRLPIFLRSNTYSEDPINMFDYQADEKLRKFKEQFKKSTEIFQKRQSIIERKTQRNIKKENFGDSIKNHHANFNNEKRNFELINKKYPNKNINRNSLILQKNTESIIIFIKSEKQQKEQLPTLANNFFYINRIVDLVNNFYLYRKKVSRGQPFWKPLFSFFAQTFFISRLSKLHRRFRDSVLIINYCWIPFGPFMSILFTFLWKNIILNFSHLSNNKNLVLYFFGSSTKQLKNVNNSLLISYLLFKNNNTNQKNQKINLNILNYSQLLASQKKLDKKNNLKKIISYCTPFQINQNFNYKQFSQELTNFWENINDQNSLFSEITPPSLNRIFLWNFVKFEKKYERGILKWMNKNHKSKQKSFLIQSPLFLNSSSSIDDKPTFLINKYQSIFINNQEQSAQNRYMHYNTYDPKVRLYRFYTNFSKNFNDIGILRDAKNVHPFFVSLLSQIYSGLFLTESNKIKRNIFQKQFPTSPYHFVPSSFTKNILLIGNTNSSNFVLLVQAFAAETGLKLFMEDAKRLRRLGRRGINKSTKRLEKLFDIAQAHSPSIILLEDIDVIGSKRRVIKINEEEDDEDMAIRSFFSKLIYKKQHQYKSLSKSFIYQNLFINNQEVYQNMQKSIIPKNPIPSNLIKYQLTRRKAFSNYFSNTSAASYKTFLTKFNILKKVSSIDSNNDFSSSPTNAVIIWKLLKSKLVTPKKTIKEAPWEHIPIDLMRSIPLITYSIRVKVAKLTMLAIYTMNTQLRLVKDLIKLLEKIQYESYKGFIVFATTNKLATLDPSLRRPGRFDETIYLPSLTVNPNYQHIGRIHFLNVLSVDSQNFVNFYRIFNIITASNFTSNWNFNSVYNNVFLQENTEKLFYPKKMSISHLINLTADNVYNQNLFMQTQKNIYLNFISYDILGNIGFQKPDFSIYSKSIVLLSLAYSKAGQLIIKLFFKKQSSSKNSLKLNKFKTKKILNNISFNSENNELSLWPNSQIFSQFKKMNISYIRQHKSIKNLLVFYFAGKIGEFCFFSFYKNIQNNIKSNKKNFMNKENNKKMKLNHFFDKNSFGLQSLYSIQPNWKNINFVIFFLIRTSCIYSKNHLASKFFYLDDISKKRQKMFSENLGPSLLYEYFNVNTEYFLKRNLISLEEQLNKQQTQKYLLNLQKKPLRKYIFNSTILEENKKLSYFNKNYNKDILLTEKNHNLENQKNPRLALFRILFNELGSLDLIALRPTAMNYYYEKKMVSKHRFRKYTYKWWNWHFKRTIDALEEFQYLDFFPYADKQYNPRRQRWILRNGYSAYWLAQDKFLYYQIYEQLIIECFQKSYLQLERHREMLDYLVQLLLTKQVLTEIEWILFFKRFS